MSHLLLTAEQLCNGHCHAASVADRLSDAELAQQRLATPEWRLAGGALERTFSFGDFHRTMAFVNTVAALADSEDHHPQLLVEYGRCVVRFNTHSAGGITQNDFICAAKIDALHPDAG
jgi:4a-hydroxytetrahydrobiopterin dehydratase